MDSFLLTGESWASGVLWGTWDPNALSEDYGGQLEVILANWCVFKWGMPLVSGSFKKKHDKPSDLAILYSHNMWVWVPFLHLIYGLNAWQWCNERYYHWGEKNPITIMWFRAPPWTCRWGRHATTPSYGGPLQDKGKNMIQAVLSGLRPDTRYVLSGLCAVNSAPSQRH